MKWATTRMSQSKTGYAVHWVPMPRSAGPWKVTASRRRSGAHPADRRRRSGLNGLCVCDLRAWCESVSTQKNMRHMRRSYFTQEFETIQARYGCCMMLLFDAIPCQLGSLRLLYCGSGSMLKCVREDGQLHFGEFAAALHVTALRRQVG